MTTVSHSEPTYREVLDATIARQPKRCPACGSSDIVPTFLELLDWECLERDCMATWTAEL